MDTGLEPITPRKHKSHHEINGIVSNLRDKHQLALPIRHIDDSPSDIKPTLGNLCYAKIKAFYFKDPDGLYRILDEFNHDMTQRSLRPKGDMDAKEKLMDLHNRLLEHAKAIAAILTPGRSTGKKDQESRSRNGSSLRASITSAPIRKPDFHPNETTEEEPHAVKMLIEADIPSLYSTALGTRPGSPTDSDDSEGFATPPQSPSLDAQNSARRRNITPPVMYPDLSGLPPPRKRPSEEAVTTDDRSPKYSRHSNGGPSSSIRAVPLKSFQSVSTAPTSANVLFGSTIPDDASQPQPDTAATSFATLPPLPNSSATYGSLDTETLDALERYEPTIRPLDEPLSSPIREMSLNHKSPQQPSQVEGGTLRQTDTSPKNRSVPYQIHHLYLKKDLFIDGTSIRYEHLSFIARWESIRIAKANNIPPQRVLQEGIRPGSDRVQFYSHYRAQDWWRSKDFRPAHNTVWDRLSDYYEGYTFKAKLIFNTKSKGDLFCLSLEAPSKEPSCRFQRRFGSDRFLYITIPSAKEFPSRLNDWKSDYLKNLPEWLLTTQTFLGRKWITVHVEQMKGTKTERLQEKSPPMRVILFALSGDDLKLRLKDQEEELLIGKAPEKGFEMTAYELISWHMDLKHNYNLRQPFCKAYARLDLGFSRTKPLLVANPDQIRFVNDIKADGSPEDTQFNDITLDWTMRPEPGMDMTDGCARASPEFFRMVFRAAKAQGLDMGTSVPSAFQARIGGAKGVWIISESVSSTDTEIWIEIRKSQLKISMRENDIDESRHTFEVLNWTKPLKNSALHADFMGLLTERGVRDEYIRKTTLDSLSFQEKELLELFASPESCPILLRKWANRVESKEGRSRVGSLPMQASLPTSPVERVNLLIDGGFNPLKCKILADWAQQLIIRDLMEMAKDFRLPLPKSINVLGIPDPLGILKPGEIHLYFSQGFLDEATGESFPFLDNIDVLVARHPALRRSDIQKVRATFKFELSHLMNVVVFPSRGTHALANKLQGGDYDGDTFWVCWEPNLTKPFRNAPAPVAPPKPEAYGIEVERRTLAEVTRRPHSVRKFLELSFKFQFQENLLGVSTIAYQNLCYNTGDMTCPGAMKLCDIHDLLVDSRKNGYTYGYTQFDLIRKEYSGKKPDLLAEPAYKQAMKRIAKKIKSPGEMISKVQSTKHSNTDIKDRLFFRDVIPHIGNTRDQLVKLLDTAQTADTDLSDPWDTAKSIHSWDPELKDEFAELERQLTNVYNIWVRRLGKSDNLDPDDDAYERCVLECYEAYQAIQPLNPQKPIIQGWLNPITKGAPPKWTLLKASALFCRRHWKTAFVWSMAGTELTFIKAQSSGNARSMAFDVWSYMKTRKVGAIRPGIDNGVPDLVDQDDEEIEDDIAAESYVSML